MERCDSIDRVAPNDRKMRHAHHLHVAFSNEGKLLLFRAWL